MTGNPSTRAVGMSGANEPKPPTPMGGASVSDVLEAAADLIEKPDAWTQESYALDHEGEPVDAKSEFAVCFCALGAIRHAGGYEDDVNPAAQALGNLVGALVCDWNDELGRTQADVVTALRQAARQPIPAKGGRGVSRVHSAASGSIPIVQTEKPAAPFKHGLGDILGMALRGEITPAEAQAMANAKRTGDA